jgi:hypothetical protein
MGYFGRFLGTVLQCVCYAGIEEGSSDTDIVAEGVALAVPV